MVQVASLPILFPFEYNGNLSIVLTRIGDTVRCMSFTPEGITEFWLYGKEQDQQVKTIRSLNVDYECDEGS